MKRSKVVLAVLVLLALAGLGLWLAGGGIDRVTEQRIETVLVDKGVPPDVAACMAARMVDRLTLAQLRKLENLSSREGESAIPLSRGEVMERLRRVGDNEVIEVTATAAALCAIGIG